MFGVTTVCQAKRNGLIPRGGMGYISIAVDDVQNLEEVAVE